MNAAPEDDLSRDENPYTASEAPDASGGPGAESPTVEGGLEDWIAVALGLGVLAVFAAVVVLFGEGVRQPLAEWLGRPGSWTQGPWEAFVSEGVVAWRDWFGPLLIALVVFAVGRAALGVSPARFAPAFLAVYLLATGAYLLSGQVVVKHLNLGYPLWALLLGLVISNTVGVAGWLRGAVCTELYIKTGLVLLGAEVLLDRLLALGLPGIFVSWVVTPIVLVSTFLIGQRLLRIASPSLNMVISADMSVCGVSAAIATAAACRAKKEELSIAVSLSLLFTVVMMVVLPQVVSWLEMDHIIGGAWIGGTIDATGAVAAAGATLSPIAETTAATIKMIQNVLIGVIAFGVAVYWATRMEPGAGGERPDAGEIWRRFPKFVIGFVLASLVFTGFRVGGVSGGAELVEAAVMDGTKVMRGWFFCLAFVSIGLDTDFRRLLPHLGGGKPLVLYILGQSLNLMLTLGMAYLMFGVLFRDWIEEMLTR